MRYRHLTWYIFSSLRKLNKLSSIIFINLSQLQNFDVYIFDFKVTMTNNPSLYLFGSCIRVTSLLFAEQRAIHRVVLLQLHSLHLLLNRVHGGVCVSSHSSKRRKSAASNRNAITDGYSKFADIDWKHKRFNFIFHNEIKRSRIIYPNSTHRFWKYSEDIANV